MTKGSIFGFSGVICFFLLIFIWIWVYNIITILHIYYNFGGSCTFFNDNVKRTGSKIPEIDPKNQENYSRTPPVAAANEEVGTRDSGGGTKNPVSCIIIIIITSQQREE